MKILYYDNDIAVCIKPAGVLSTDEEGGLPGILRAKLGGEIRTVHRLDRVVSGVMVLARNKDAATALSAQITQQTFEKEYLAVVHGNPDREEDTLRDLLWRDKRRKMTFVSDVPGKDVREAVLDYRTLDSDREYSLLRIRLHTGRTHQIRVQFASRDLPLAGERKYYEGNDPWPLALFSSYLCFVHPTTGATMKFSALPEETEPWNRFPFILRLRNEA